jgi:hypothetical protein
MPGPCHKVALVNVIGPHSDAHQILHQFAHQVRVIIDACQEHRLVAQWDPRPGQFVTGFFELSGNFIGMVHVDVHPQGMELL